MNLVCFGQVYGMDWAFLYVWEVLVIKFKSWVFDLNILYGVVYASGVLLILWISALPSIMRSCAICVVGLLLIMLYNILIYLVFIVLLKICCFIIDLIGVLLSVNNKSLYDSEIDSALIIKDDYKMRLSEF